jgi:hypothetical protein
MPETSEPVSECADGVAENGMALGSGKDVCRRGWSLGRLIADADGSRGPTEGRFFELGRLAWSGPGGEEAIAMKRMN